MMLTNLKKFLIITAGTIGFLLTISFLFVKSNSFFSRSLLEERVITIDPGHGGIDSGSSHAGVTEKDITLAISKVIAAELEKHGASVILTRTDDTDLWNEVSIEDEINYTKREYQEDLELGRSIDPRDKGIALGNRRPPTYRLGLRARLLKAEANKSDILISIHTNHFRSESAKGAVTLYQPHSLYSQRLAIAIQNQLNSLLPGRNAPGIIADDFFVLRRSKIPTVIIEIGFVSNKHDREFMLSDEGQQAIANAIARGIEEYFKGL